MGRFIPKVGNRHGGEKVGVWLLYLVFYFFHIIFPTPLPRRILLLSYFKKGDDTYFMCG